jgi:hypothetical protein
MPEASSPVPPLIPPEAFMLRLNSQRAPAPPLSALDPLALAAWHAATESLRSPGPLLIVTGI